MQNSTPVLSSLEQAVQLDASLSYFDLNMTAAERKAVEKLKITKYTGHTNYQLAELEKETAAFLEMQGNSAGVSKTIGNMIERLARQTAQLFGKEEAWVDLRASLPNKEYDVPRWHIDGYYFQNPDKELHKVALALKGTATLFNTAAGKDKEDFVDALRRGPRMEEMEHRRLLHGMLDPALTEVPPAHHGAVFVAGSEARAAIHSEPPMPTERLFISIVPGSKEQMAAHHEASQRARRPKPT